MMEKRKYRRATRDIRIETTAAAVRRIATSQAEELSIKTARLRELRLARDGADKIAQLTASSGD
jgi:hypothetical protein